MCTMGMHVMLAGRGGTLRVAHTRVERCGQRGLLAKYCLHFHLVGRCPSCAFEGNAIEHGHQRAIVVHGTHEALVRDNTVADVRGAGIYLEDGNEMDNRVLYNVVVCPHSRDDPVLRGCTVPGTDNDQADTALNQAAIWALPAANHLVGNRAANSFNGLFIQSNFASNGRGAATGSVCTESQGLGRVRGNANHGHGRFGWYLLGPNFPRRVQQSVESDGRANMSTCAGFEADVRAAPPERTRPRLWMQVRRRLAPCAGAAPHVLTAAIGPGYALRRAPSVESPSVCRRTSTTTTFSSGSMTRVTCSTRTMPR
jgi:hypothetical protein